MATSIRSALRFFPAALLASGLIAAGTGGARGEAAVKSTHGDWQMRCELQPGTKPPREQCALVQSVADDENPTVRLIVIVLRSQDGKSRILRVMAPLMVEMPDKSLQSLLLPSGLGLKIDDKEIGRAGFVRCFARMVKTGAEPTLDSGCVAEVVMDENLIDQLRNGKSATFIIFPTPEEGIGIPVSLEGFAKGFEALP